MIEGLEKRIGCTKLLNSAFHCKQILFSLLSRDIFFLKANGVIYQLIHTIVFKILFMYVPVHLRVLLLVSLKMSIKVGVLSGDGDPLLFVNHALGI